MQPSARPSAPLARSTLLHMGVRIAVIIALTTLLSYLHMFHTLRAEALAQLEQHVAERGQREQAVFVLAEDNHTFLKEALEARIRALSPEEVRARFDALFVHLPDGTVRNRPEGFDGTKMPGVFVPRGVTVDEDLRRRILASYDVLTWYAPAFSTRFTDTFITLPEGPNIVYWPERPTFSHDASPTESLIAQAFFPLTRPENNPERKTIWTGAYLEPVSDKTLTTVSTPLDLEGRHAATISHDVLLEELVARELKDVHLQLVQSARRAGMAEIATNVLHNVGNVLNSVYTSAQLAKERMAGMRLEHVSRVAQLLQERQSDAGTFLAQDERGKNVVPFLNKLGRNLLDERQEIVTYLNDVGRYTEHIGDIVKVQQNYARTPRLQEPVHLAGLVEDAIRINAAGLTRHQVKVVRQLADLPPVLTDKHKTLMILINLVSNAKYAMDGVPVAERLLTVKLERTPHSQVRIQVHDNGMGIAPEMLTRIFQYGFTTREEGHGFGLHSSALAAQELGGSLTVHSDGPGRGATFTLELPFQQVQEVA